MRQLQIITVVAILTAGAAGCATTLAPAGPPAASTSIRDAIGRLAVRTPTSPTVTLTNRLDTKGRAAGKTALAAGAGWLGGTIEAAGETGEPLSAGFIALIGLATTPLVAAGGAIYGASAADTDEAIAAGNRSIDQTLDFGPQLLNRVMESRFAGGVPVPYEFVGNEKNAALAARGFDSVLDVHLQSITSTPSENSFHVRFEIIGRVVLTSPHSNRTLWARVFQKQLAARAVSVWARDQGRVLLADLERSFGTVVGETAQELFDAPAIRLRGLQPVSRHALRTRATSSTVPVFAWSALDGRAPAGSQGIEYEMTVYRGTSDGGQTFRTTAQRFRPVQPLRKCARYRWKVRAHYASFGKPTSTGWTPAYRFRTPCR